MLYINIVANIIYIIFGIFAIIRYGFIKCLLIYVPIKFNQENSIKFAYSAVFIGLQMHIYLFIFFYSILLVLAIINLIKLFSCIKNEDIYEKYFKKQISKYFFIIFILASIFNVYGYTKKDDDDDLGWGNITKIKLWLFLFNLIFSLIVLINLYYKNYIQNNESNENTEDKKINLGKIIYDSFLIFHIYFLFYIIEEIVIEYQDLEHLIFHEDGVPLIFEIIMSVLVEILFGLIGLALIYKKKAITYGIYQTFIYVAFLIYRIDIGQYNDSYSEDNKFIIIDYIISIFMIGATVIFIFKKKK